MHPKVHVWFVLGEDGEALVFWAWINDMKMLVSSLHLLGHPVMVHLDKFTSMCAHWANC